MSDRSSIGDGAATSADSAPLSDLLSRAAQERTGLAQAGGTLPPSDVERILEHRTAWRDALRRFCRNRLALVAGIILLVMITLSIFVPMLSSVDPNEIDYASKELGPSTSHLFGTDGFGRDMWVRSWIGGRISLAVAFAVALAILLIGLVYGTVAGIMGGIVDAALMRFLDSLYGLPYLPFAIIAASVVHLRLPDANPLVYMVPALALTSWFTAARIIRTQVVALRKSEFVMASRAAGSGSIHVAARHLIPNTLGILIIAIFLEVPNAILGEATLSFLGLGVTVPQASWGSMAFEGYSAFESHPHYILIPGTLIAVTVLCAVAIADGVRDALDPRLD